MMPRFFLFFLFLFFCVVARAEEIPLSNLTLKDAYQLALKRSEIIAIQHEVIKETEGRFLQAFSGLLPSVSFVDSEKFQDAPRRDGANRRYTPQRAFTFTQPLFSGFKEFAAIAGAKAERKQRGNELLRAKQLLLIDVSDAFYLFKSYQEDVKALDNINKALQERLTELKRRQGLGRSRRSEVASTESRFYQNQAELESARSQQDTSRQLLEFLAGKRIESIAGQDVFIASLGTVDDYLSKVDLRPDVKAAEQASIVAAKKVVAARSGFWPTVDLVGNQYMKRVGSAADVDWDLTLNVTVPLFNGTETMGEVKTAKALSEQAQLNFSKTRREALLDIENAYTRLLSDFKQNEAYAKAYEAASANYDLQKEDYSNNQVSNLDVLQSLEDLGNTQRSYNAIKNQTQRAYWVLKAAIGDIDDTF